MSVKSERRGGEAVAAVVSAVISRISLRRPQARHVAKAQSAYYIVTGVWPLVSRQTFEAVSGRKQDYWLVQTVGALVGVTGAALAIAARDERSLHSPSMRTLGVGTALSLATVDLTFALRGRISPIYLADAAAELGLVAGWLGARDSFG